jgi:hypothetical protein
MEQSPPRSAEARYSIATSGSISTSAGLNLPAVLLDCYRLAPGCTEEFEEGAVTPVLVLPKFPTALFNVGDEPRVLADPMLLPVVPWLFALLVFAPGAPPRPFTVAPLLSVVPDPEDVPPVEALGDAPAERPEDPPPADPPPPPPPL